MRNLLLTLIMFFCLVGVALAEQTITLEWNANTDIILGYRIYERVEGGTYVYGEATAKASTLVGTETVTFQTSDVKKYYVATAYDADGESGPSNEVSTGPSPPGGLRITVTTTTTVTIE